MSVKSEQNSWCENCNDICFITFAKLFNILMKSIWLYCQPEEDEFTVVPDSQFVVSRTAFKDNSSYYKVCVQPLGMKSFNFSPALNPSITWT